MWTTEAVFRGRTSTTMSRLEVEGQPVHVLTVCHPKYDMIAVRVESPLLEAGRLTVSLKFPYGSTEWGKAADWEHPERHTTEHRIEGRQADLTCTLDADRYSVRVICSPGGEIQVKSRHEYEIAWQDGGSLEVVIAFSPTQLSSPLPSFDEVRTAATEHWSRFWMRGAAIDFSGSSDPRASELERRVVLSQYLTAVECAGSSPPQETGLTCNSWYGKSHLEMHWWHAVHFALWGRLGRLPRPARPRVSGQWEMERAMGRPPVPALSHRHMYRR